MKHLEAEIHVLEWRFHIFRRKCNYKYSSIKKPSEIISEGFFELLVTVKVPLQTYTNYFG